MTKTVAIIQARMTSTRLPGKVLADVVGKPLLHWMLDRVTHSLRIDEVWVATTVNGTDDPVAHLCATLNIPVFRGDEQDVLGRFHGAALAAGATVVVRLTADCPLMDGALIDGVIERFAEGGSDYVSNVLERTYPDGLDVEVFSFAALDAAFRETNLPFQREHVTPYLQTGWHPDTLTGNFSITHVLHEEDLGELRWTVDYPSDLELIRRMFAILPVGFSWLDALACFRADPSLQALSEMRGVV